MKNSEGKFAYLEKPPNMYFLYLKLICIPSPRVGLVAYPDTNTCSLSDAAHWSSCGGFSCECFSEGQSRSRTLSKACPAWSRWAQGDDGICDLDSRLGCSSLLECCLSPPDLSCTLPNKYFSSLHSSDYALHWIQIKRQNVSLISTVMWDR